MKGVAAIPAVDPPRHVAHLAGTILNSSVSLRINADNTQLVMASRNGNCAVRDLIKIRIDDGSDKGALNQPVINQKGTWSVLCITAAICRFATRAVSSRRALLYRCAPLQRTALREFVPLRGRLALPRAHLQHGHAQRHLLGLASASLAMFRFHLQMPQISECDTFW